MAMTKVGMIINCMFNSTCRYCGRHSALCSGCRSLRKYFPTGCNLHISQVRRRDFVRVLYSSCLLSFARFLKGVHYSVTLFNVGSVGALMLMTMVEVLGQGSCIPPCGSTRSMKMKSQNLNHIFHYHVVSFCLTWVLQATLTCPQFLCIRGTGLQLHFALIRLWGFLM